VIEEIVLRCHCVVGQVSSEMQRRDASCNIRCLSTARRSEYHSLRVEERFGIFVQHPWTPQVSSMADAVFFKKCSPGDAGRQIGNVTADTGKVGFVAIVDKTRRLFTRL
jgi:hypothetical protein